MVSAGIQQTLLLCDGAEKFSIFIKSLIGLSLLHLSAGSKDIYL